MRCERIPTTAGGNRRANCRPRSKRRSPGPDGTNQRQPKSEHRSRRAGRTPQLTAVPNEAARIAALSSPEAVQKRNRRPGRCRCAPNRVPMTAKKATWPISATRPRRRAFTWLRRSQMADACMKTWNSSRPPCPSSSLLLSGRALLRSRVSPIKTIFAPKWSRISASLSSNTRR